MVRPIVFLSDYGLADEFVGVCHGVIATIAPGARVIDLTHAVPPQDVLRGAILLGRSVRFMPPGAVYLAIVDPGVGAERRSVAVESAAGSLLVGPDNGVLSLAWRELGGPALAVEITSPGVLLRPVSATFHGRDVFAPAAAHLAGGLPIAELGPDVPVGTLREVDIPTPRVAPGEVRCQVLAVDGFGNVELPVRPEDLTAAGLGEVAVVEVRGPRGGVRARRARTFADVPAGDVALLVDSSGWVALAVNRGSAARALGLSPGDAVVLAGAPS